MTTTAQRSAQKDAHALARQLQSHGPVTAQPTTTIAGGFCRADGLIVTYETLSGEYDLDGPLGDEVLRRLGGPTGPSMWPAPVASPGAGANGGGASQAMRDYVLGDWGGQGLGSEIASATIGPGNVLGNAMGAAQAAEHVRVQAEATRQLQQAAQRITSRQVRQVRINAHMTLYDAAQGRGRPRLRLRVTKLPITVVSQAAGAGGWRSNRAGTRASTRWAPQGTTQARMAANIAAETHWQNRFGWATGKVGVGVLTFAPSAAIDMMNSLEYETDAHGVRRLKRFDSDKFIVASAKSQSGNALGLGASVVAGAGLAAIGVVGAPVIVIGLLAGLAVQVAWNTYGGADWAARQAQRAVAD